MLAKILLPIALYTSLVSAHTVLTYPGWRGDNLIKNDTFPYGMQWQYPCGGMPTSTNRTKWPVGGGAVAIQPGWFRGHATAFFYVNIGFGTDGPDGGPPNMSFPMVPVFQITGPTSDPYPGAFCLPQIPLPANTTVNIGDNATIQILEIAVHGAALFNCVDITFADPEEVPEVNAANCFNSSDIMFNDVYVASKTSVNTTSTTSSVTTSMTSAMPSTSEPGGLSTGAKAGIGVSSAIIFLAIIFCGLIFFNWRRRYYTRTSKIVNPESTPSGVPEMSTTANTCELLTESNIHELADN